MARIHITIEKSLNDHGNDGVGTHLEPDILECEVKQALAKLTTNKASGGDEVSLELIKILKDGAVKVLHLMYQHISWLHCKLVQPLWETVRRLLKKNLK